MSAPGLKIVKKTEEQKHEQMGEDYFCCVGYLYGCFHSRCCISVYQTMQDQGDCIQVGSATTEKREWRIL